MIHPVHIPYLNLTDFLSLSSNLLLHLGWNGTIRNRSLIQTKLNTEVHLHATSGQTVCYDPVIRWRSATSTTCWIGGERVILAWGEMRHDLYVWNSMQGDYQTAWTPAENIHTHIALEILTYSFGSHPCIWVYMCLSLIWRILRVPLHQY